MFNFILPKLILNIERWKYNKEYDIYVSTLDHFKDSKKRLLPVKVSEGGYLRVRTSRGAKSAHRLVMLTWRPIPNAEELTVDHLNHNKRDNSLINLEWVTVAENQARAIKDFELPSQSIKVTKTKKIYCVENAKIFNSTETAAQWLIANVSYLRNNHHVDIKNVTKKIRKACISGDEYNKYHWKEIEQICYTQEHILE